MPNCGNQTQNLGYKAAGYPGKQKRLLGGGANSNGGSGMEGGSSRESTRFVLREAWNGAAATGTVKGVKIGATPFRAVNNAGDLLDNISNEVLGAFKSVSMSGVRNTCKNIVDDAVDGIDVWGWHKNGREFALMLTASATVFVEITNPTKPVIVGKLAAKTKSS